MTLQRIGDTESETADTTALRSDRTRRSIDGALVAAVAAIGLGLRLWGLGRAPINADEAIVGLMAHQILHGHFFAFFWGQRYGGGEPYVVALVFALFGQSAFTLGLAPLLLDATCALLVWRIGHRMFSPLVGTAAGLLFWIWPEVFVQLSTVEYGFRWFALGCGLLLFLQALRIVDDSRAGIPRNWLALANWTAFGGALGLGWWASPEIAYYALPAIGLIVVRVAKRRCILSSGGVGLAVVFAVLGALPWLWRNVTHHFVSLHEHRHSLSLFVRHLETLGTHVVPLLLGLRVRQSGAWLLPSPVGQVVYAIVLICGALYLIKLVHDHKALPLVAFCLLAPFEYAAAPTDYWRDGRYSIYFAPVVAILAIAALKGVGEALSRPKSEEVAHRIFGAVLAGTAIVIALALTVSAMTRIAPYKPTKLVSSQLTWTTWQTNPNGWLDPVIASLHAKHIDAIYSGYWVGTVIDFESHASITSTDIPYARYRPYLAFVTSSRRTAWLFLEPEDRLLVRAETSTGLVNPGCVDNRGGCLAAATLESYLVATHDPYQASLVGAFIEVIPSRPVNATAFLPTVRRGTT